LFVFSCFVNLLGQLLEHTVPLCHVALCSIVLLRFRALLEQINK